MHGCGNCDQIWLLPLPSDVLGRITGIIYLALLELLSPSFPNCFNIFTSSSEERVCSPLLNDSSWSEMLSAEKMDEFQALLAKSKYSLVTECAYSGGVGF